MAQEIAALGRSARVLQFDVTDRETAAATLLADVEAHGCYYGVVCNAGIARDNAFPAMSGDDWDDVIHTNLTGFYNVLHPLTMPMVRRRRPGRIVTISSVSGVMGIAARSTTARRRPASSARRRRSRWNSRRARSPSTASRRV